MWLFLIHKICISCFYILQISFCFVCKRKCYSMIADRKEITFQSSRQFKPVIGESTNLSCNEFNFKFVSNHCLTKWMFFAVCIWKKLLLIIWCALSLIPTPIQYANVHPKMTISSPFTLAKVKGNFGLPTRSRYSRNKKAIFHGLFAVYTICQAYVCEYGWMYKSFWNYIHTFN